MPAAVAKLSRTILSQPVNVAVEATSTAADTVSQSLYYVNKSDKKRLLTYLIEENDIQTALVFTRTKHNANRVAEGLNRAGIRAEAIHSNKSQSARQKALKNFKDQRIRVLVATDIASRGIDVDELSHVINFELPDSPETYVHRIGRTGRAGANGFAFSFCDDREAGYLHDIHRLIDQRIPVVDDHPYAVQMPQRAAPPRPARRGPRPASRRRRSYRRA
jgi:ATP-dependent RNA helicase RhlE